MIYVNFYLFKQPLFLNSHIYADINEYNLVTWHWIHLTSPTAYSYFFMLITIPSTIIFYHSTPLKTFYYFSQHFFNSIIEKSSFTSLIFILIKLDFKAMFSFISII